MEKLDQINQAIDEIRLSEGEMFVLNQMNIADEIKKFEQQNASLLIKTLTILGAFLGSTFMVASITTMFRLNSNPYLFFSFGLLLVIVSAVSSRFKKTLIFETSFVAILLWGSFLVSVSLNQLKLDENLICVYFLLNGIFILIVSKNSYQILISLLMIAGSFLWLIKMHQYSWLFHGYTILIVFALVQLFLNEAKFLSSKHFLATIYYPLISGLMIVLLISLGLVSSKLEMFFPVSYNWISSIAPSLAILFFLKNVLNKLEITETNNLAFVYTFCVILLAVTALSPGISGSILVLLLCFYGNYKTGVAVALLSLLYFVIMFYYDLDFSLLTKSEILFGSGLLFGGMYFLSAKKLATDEKI